MSIWVVPYGENKNPVFQLKQDVQLYAPRFIFMPTCFPRHDFDAIHSCCFYMVQVIKSIVIYFCSHIELAQTMLRKTVVALFIATIYINTAYAQEIRFEKETFIPGWNGLEGLVKDAYKHYESTSPTYAQPTSGRVGFIDGLGDGEGRHGIEVQAVYCWYLSSFDDGCVYPSTFTTTTIEGLPFDYEFAGLPVKYVYTPNPFAGREFRNEFISDDIVTISATGGTISRDCGQPSNCAGIVLADITPSTGAHLVYPALNRRTANSISQSLAVSRFEVIREIVRTTSKILTVNGYNSGGGDSKSVDLTKQVCTGAEAWCIQSEFSVRLDYFGGVSGNSFGTPLVGVVMWAMRQVSPTMTATDVFERVRKCTWVPDGVTTPDSIWGVGQLRATHDCLFPVKKRVIAETTQTDTTEMIVVTRVVTTSTVVVIDNGVLTTKVITLTGISTDISVAEDSMVTTTIGFFQDTIPRGTTDRFSSTEDVTLVSSTRREMTVTEPSSTTRAFVGYTGSLITTETVTQTFVDQLVRGTRTTVDGVMTSPIRTSTLPVVTIMTTGEGELSTEVVTTEDQAITLLVTTNTTTIAGLVEDGIATTTVATVTLTSTDTFVRIGVYTTTTVYLPSGETTIRLSFTEDTTLVSSTQREMTVTEPPSTTKAFVGYTGSLITTETVTQTFVDQLVRGTRTTVDDVMTFSIRTSTLPVVTTMTTRDGELSMSTERMLPEQSTTLTLTKRTQMTTVRLVGNGSTLVITTITETIRDVSVTTTVAYTTEKTIVRHDGVLYTTSTVRATTLRSTTTTSRNAPMPVTEDTEAIPSTLQGDKTIVTTVVTITGRHTKDGRTDVFDISGPPTRTEQTGSLTPSVVKLRLHVFLGGAVR